MMLSLFKKPKPASGVTPPPASAARAAFFGVNGVGRASLARSFAYEHCVGVFDAAAYLADLDAGAQPLNVALLVLDAEEGVRAADKAQIRLIRGLGIETLVLLVNRHDAIAFEQDQFDLMVEEIGEEAQHHGLSVAGCVPVCALEGDNLSRKSGNTPWYQGDDLLTLLTRLSLRTPAAPLRVRVVDAIKHEEGWLIDGQVVSGVLRPRDRLLVSPSNKLEDATELHIDGKPCSSAPEGRRVAIHFAGPLHAVTGELLSLSDRPPVETDVFRAQVTLENAEHLTPGATLRIDLHGQQVSVEVQETVSGLPRFPGFQHVVLRAPSLVALDSFQDVPATGYFKVIHEGTAIGAGFISMDGYADQRGLVTPKSSNLSDVEQGVTQEERAARNGHKGGVLWFTGLSGSGKSTLAMRLEAELFAKGYNVYVLDGDNVRQGLSANLGFSPDDRAENIRRIGEVAALFQRAGVLVISSFISPYRSDRDRARHAAGEGFHEVYIEAGIETCISRDPKGLYRRALSGEIPEFTGITAPYEAPTDPDLILNTETGDVEACLQRLVNYVDSHFHV